MSFSFAKQKQTTTSHQEQDPWKPAIPYLKDYIGKLGAGLDNSGATAAQTSAINNLEAHSANPWAGKIGQVADKAFAANSQAPTVSDAYTKLQGQLGDYASGKNLDFSTNPYIQKMLGIVGDDAQNRINAQFAGAGRDLSGANSMASARGVTQATAPILANLFTTAQGQQIDASKSLYNAGNTTAHSVQDLNTDALHTNAAGVDLSKAAVDATNQGDRATLGLEQQRKDIPNSQFETLGPLLAQIAGLGGTSDGRSKTKGSSFGGKFDLAALLGAAFPKPPAGG